MPKGSSPFHDVSSNVVWKTTFAPDRFLSAYFLAPAMRSHDSDTLFAKADESTPTSAQRTAAVSARVRSAALNAVRLTLLHLRTENFGGLQQVPKGHRKMLRLGPGPAT